jgi:hypothetical protein
LDSAVHITIEVYMRLTLSALSLILAGGIALTGIPSDAQNRTIYKPAGDATLHYNDGVTVHRHSDGSVEVGDGPSAPEPLYPSQGRSVRRVARKHAAARKVTTTKTTTSTAKKHK